ncbi:MAG TPA: sulfatase [Lacipirellulaceae bacterium]|jgi:arylsulfatase A-like enzyme|nr:sulfatase [Lacipirellulaceae bacterium]
MRTLLSLILLALLIPLSAFAADSQHPNIVFILADDLGYADLACFGSKYYETPNIDRLATEGMRFTNGYSCGPNCQPSRAALMSGQYGPRTGIYTVGDIDRFDWRSRPLRPVDNVTSLPLDKITIADTLKKAGYATGMFGKWHLGMDADHFPAKRGFDEAIESSGVHFDFKTTPKTDYPKGQYLADFLTDHAVDFIERHKDQPFFLYLPHFGVHAPHQAKPELISKFKGKPPVGGQKSAAYAAMIASVDESVGRVVATLDKLGLTDNTLVIFSSDNGGVGGYERAGLSRNGVTDNAPLKGGKGMLYEGGIRVPYIFRWKGKIQPATENDTPIMGIDLYPTLVEVAGTKAPTDYPLDGQSLMPLLTGAQKALGRSGLAWHFPGYLGFGPGEWRTTPAGAVRFGDWKLIEFFEDGRQELYNLKDDVGEQHNLAAAEPDKAEELHDKMLAWREQLGAKMPTKNDEQGTTKKLTKKERQARKQARQDAGDDE